MHCTADQPLERAQRRPPSSSSRSIRRRPTRAAPAATARCSRSTRSSNHGQSGGSRAEQVEQALGQRLSRIAWTAAVALERAQVLVDPEQRVGPRARAGEARHRAAARRGRGGRPRLCRPGSRERPDDGAERPQRASVAVLGAAVLGPVPRVGHEVPEAPARRGRTRGARTRGSATRASATSLASLAPRVLERAPSRAARARCRRGSSRRRSAGTLNVGVLQNAGVVGHGARCSRLSSGSSRRALRQRLALERRAPPRRRALRARARSSRDTSARPPARACRDRSARRARRRAIRRLVVAEEADHLAGDRRADLATGRGSRDPRRAARGVRVRRGDHGPAGSDRVGQGARGDLLRLEIRRDVDVGGREELGELGLADEAVVEDHVRVHAERAGRGPRA